ncbi:MAG: hypothetical protein GY842_03075, partial [bacterium]|nr:hypothetical protein [bacterium]
MVLSTILLTSLTLVGQVGPLSHELSLTGPLDSPARLAVTDSEILVTDPRNDAIVRFELDGTYLGTWS